jgi:tetratricopeptide (TPR) repeat protein
MTISACLIMKNEERWLRGCLENLKALCSEIIIVDTGSTDQSMAIAREYGVRLSSQKWENDFSKARNASLERATGRWILVIDPDERIAERDLERIRQLTLDTSVMAYTIKTRNYSSNAMASGFVPCTGEYKDEEGEYPGYFESGKIRLFQNIPSIRFVGSVHELVEATVKGKVLPSDVPIHHYGSTEQVAEEKNKRSFYQAAARQKLQEEPKNWKAHFEHGVEMLGIGEFKKAMESLKKARELNPTEPLVLTNLGYAAMEAGKHSEAEEALKACLEKDPKNHDAFLNLGVNEMRRQNWPLALECFDRCVKMFPKSFLAFRNAGNSFARMKKFKEAAACFEHSLKIFPDYHEARIDLGIVCFAGGRLDLAEKFLSEALSKYPTSLRAQAVLDEVRKAQKK